MISENEQPIAVGDLVRLDSGGPVMTVEYLSPADPGTVGVVWFDAAERLQRGRLNARNLHYAG